jgi:hypothetical protein
MEKAANKPMRLLFIICLILPLATFSQQLRGKKVSVRMTDVSLETALSELSHLTGYTFSYSDDVIPLNTPVSISVNESEIRQILDPLFRDLPVGYRISGNRVILKKVPAPLYHSISGFVKDAQGSAVPGANVLVVNTSPLIGGTSDNQGKFRIDRVPVGRVSVQVSSVGFVSALFKDMLLSTGKELVLDVVLEESITPMNEIEIRSDVTDDDPDAFFEEGHSFTTEESKRYAGSFGDPARMASSFAGVTGASDESNALIIRGNSPRGVLWRINGIEAPNPNHFASEGSSNGVISVLSSNVIGNATLLKGGFSPSYGNALSGVLDISLRKGNPERYEHSFQIGALGVEASSEGPITRNNNNSYLVNYRYSTLNLLDKIGANLEDVGKYSDYQDLAFNTSFQTQNSGRFSLFGIGGKSTSRKTISNGTDIDRSEVGIAGITYDVPLSRQTALGSALSWSGSHISNDRRIQRSSDIAVRLNENYSKQYVRGTLSLNHSFSDRFDVQTGLIFSSLTYDFYLRNLDPTNTFYEEIFNFREQGSTSILQAYASGKQHFSEKVRGQYGMHFIRFGLTGDYSIEPRGRLEVDVAKGRTLTFIASKHSRIENLQYYLARDHQEGGDEIHVNRDLGFTRSNHFGASFDRKSNLINFLVEGYFQQLYNAPVRSDDASWYSAINEDSGFVTDTLTNLGEGRNYGIEIAFDRPLKNGLYYLVNMSLYQSRFGLNGVVDQNTSYNGNYILHALIGREVALGKNTLFGANLKSTLGGGRRYTPVDLEESIARGYQVLNWAEAFEHRLPQYFRTDLQLSLRNSREKFATEVRLDIQNITHHRNIAYFYFDTGKQSIQRKLQVGILPVVTFRIEF